MLGFYKLLALLVCRLPQWLVAIIGGLLGKLLWLLVPKWRKQMATDNIATALQLNEDDALSIARRSCQRLGTMLMEVLRLPRLNSYNIAATVEIEGAEHLRAALAQGRGVVLATAHSGNWELLGAALAMNNFPLAAVVARQHNSVMDQWITWLRSNAGMKVVVNNGVRSMVRTLDQGNIVGLLMDHDPGQANKGIFVRFFNRPALTPTGAAFFARLRQAPVVPAFITEVTAGHHKAVIMPAVTLPSSEDKATDIRVGTEILTAIIEKWIAEHAAEWFWLHNRWKSSEKAKLDNGN